MTRKTLLKLFSSIFLMNLVNANPAFSEIYELDTAHSTLGFGVKHFGINTVKGSFNEFSGTISYDPQRPEETKVIAEIKSGSIDTANQKRDEHVRSKDFIDSQVYPTFRFHSTSVKPTGPDSMIISGELTMLGITKALDLTVSNIVGPILNPLDKKKHVGASVTGKLVRQDFRVTWDGAGVTGAAGEAAIGDEIKIEFEIDGVEK